GVHVVTSLAGRVAAPALPVGEVRVGGFGGIDGLVAYLRHNGVDVLVDATHPFATTNSASAARAAELTGVALVVLRRPAWEAGPGDDWRPVPTLAAAAALVERPVAEGPPWERVFLTTGRQSLAAFAASRKWFLARPVDPPTPPVPARLAVLLHRG